MEELDSGNLRPWKLWTVKALDCRSSGLEALDRLLHGSSEQWKSCTVEELGPWKSWIVKAVDCESSGLWKLWAGKVSDRLPHGSSQQWKSCTVEELGRGNPGP